jgi:hypothetical protein
MSTATCIITPASPTLPRDNPAPAHSELTPSFDSVATGPGVSLRSSLSQNQPVIIELLPIYKLLLLKTTHDGFRPPIFQGAASASYCSRQANQGYAN